MIQGLRRTPSGEIAERGMRLIIVVTPRSRRPKRIGLASYLELLYTTMYNSLRVRDGFGEDDMHRTNIYLSDDQRGALRQLTAVSGETMSDVVRRAVDRLLADEFVGRDWSGHVEALLARVDARRSGMPEPTGTEIEAAVTRVRSRRRVGKASD